MLWCSVNMRMTTSVRGNKMRIKVNDSGRKVMQHCRKKSDLPTNLNNCLAIFAKRTEVICEAGGIICSGCDAIFGKVVSLFTLLRLFVPQFDLKVSSNMPSTDNPNRVSISAKFG